MARRYSMTAAAVASTRATGSGASRVSSYLPPWLVWLGLPPVATVFWALAGAGMAAAVFVGALLAVGSAVLIWHTFSVFAKRRDRRVRWDAAITVALACVWVMAAAAFGLFHVPDVDVWPQFWRVFEWILRAFTLPVWGSWLGGGIIVALAWNIRRAAMTTDGEKEHDESPLTRALDGAKLKAITPNEKGQITAKMEGDRGRQTSDDLQKLAAGIESATRLREGAVRIAKDPKDRGAAFMTVTPDDPLQVEVTWPGPSRPGGHLADAPIPFAIAEDGEVVEIWFCGDEAHGRNLVHFLVEGANGSGKSMAWRAAIADALTRTAGKGVRLHGIDVSGKYRQTFGPLIPYMTSLATDAKAAKRLVKDISTYVAEKQGRMGAAGHTQWSKECDEPFDILWVEEGSEIAAESQELTRATERWRSAGAMLIIVIQRASWDNIDTTTRSQLGGATAFGVNDSGKGDNCLSLPSVAADQGADPSRWGSRYPGRVYVVHSTTPEERMAIPNKAFKTTNDELTAPLAAHCTPIRAADGTPLGQSIDGSLPEAQRPVSGQGADRSDEAWTDLSENEDDEGVEPIPPDPDPSIVADPTQPIGAPDPAADLPFAMPGVGGPKMPEKDFRALIQYHLRTILAGGRDRTQAADVHRMRPETGYSRESVRLELVRLCTGPYTEVDRFRLHRDESDRLGVYEIYDSALAHAQ